MVKQTLNQADPKGPTVPLQPLKQSYVRAMHGLGALPSLIRFSHDAGKARAYGWRRWAASLLAVYDTAGMVRLGVPWWNVAATREVEAFLATRTAPRVFEYGTGASTAWLAERATEVFSVEHDAAFMAHFRPLLAPFPNVTLLDRPIAHGKYDYVYAIEELGGLFDLIVVDGRHRADCLQAARRHLAPGGMILFDDSGRSRYRPAIRASGLRERHFHGRSFCVPYPDHTSLLLPKA